MTLTSRRGVVAAVAALALTATSAACTGDEAPPRPGSDWSPAPRTVDGIRVLAEADGDDVLLHTAAGARTFLPGVTVGNSVPGRRPGDLASMQVADYLRWFRQMQGVGIRVVRTYSLQPPAFYAALERHATAADEQPLYLVQGVGLPEAALAAPDSTLTDPGVTRAFTGALRQASAAVHGDLPAAAYSTDVSRWVVGWIVGNELDPALVERTDADAAAAPGGGAHVLATADATPTERWLASQLDVLAEAELARGTSTPLAFVSWPTTDPLDHPEEPVAAEDLVSVDPAHVVAAESWPGGVFAAVHAYPYYPDFLRHEPALARTSWDGEPDPYAGYLAALDDHLDMPVVVAETGVPASIGSAHRGPRERNQGPYSEQDAMAVDADLLRLASASGAAGAFLSSWTDEWWRGAWNTSAGQDPARRHHWHDPLTATQWTGLLRSDAPFIARSVASADGRGEVDRVVAQASAAFLHLLVRGTDGVPGRTRVTVDAIPGGGPEHVVEVDPAAGRAQVLVRADLDPLQHYTGVPVEDVVGAGSWHLLRQLTNDAQVVGGQAAPPEVAAVGDLVRGDWSSGSADYDSRATWRTVDKDGSLRLRLPWSMLGVTDPGRRMVLGRGGPVAATGLDLLVRSGAGGARLRYSWPTWDEVTPTTRLSAGIDVLAEAYRDTAS